jgi:hypothetical protein
MDGSAVEGGIPASAMPAVVVDSTTENNCDVVVVVVVVAVDICVGEANIKALVVVVVAAQQAMATEDESDNFMMATVMRS